MTPSPALPSHDPTCRITAQAIRLGYEVQKIHFRRKRDQLIVGLGFSVVVNVLAICGYLIGCI